INIAPADGLIDVQLTNGNNEISLATRGGLAIRFSESDVREMGRATTGGRGITLTGVDVVVGMVVAKAGTTLLVVTENGMGKRSVIEDSRLARGGGKGVINVKTTGKTGLVVAIKPVGRADELRLITRNGTVNRPSVNANRVMGRNSQ